MVSFVLTKYATLNFYIIERVLFHRISDSGTLTKRDQILPRLKYFSKMKYRKTTLIEQREFVLRILLISRYRRV